MKIINEILSIFHETSGFGGRSDFWVFLPLLPPLLSHCDLTIYQQVLMSLVVSLKTDEGQIEIISNLPDRGWTKILIDLATIGEKYAYNMSGSKSTSRGVYIHGQNEGMDDAQIMNQLTTHESIAITCTELALDAAAIMLEHKIRYHDQDAWSCWNCLQNCIKASCHTHEFGDKSDYIEKQLIKRCLSLVFQRLARSNDIWNAGMLNFIENILTLIANKSLCGQDIYGYSTPILQSLYLSSVAAGVVTPDLMNPNNFINHRPISSRINMDNPTGNNMNSIDDAMLEISNNTGGRSRVNSTVTMKRNHTNEGSPEPNKEDTTTANTTANTNDIFQAVSTTVTSNTNNPLLNNIIENSTMMNSNTNSSKDTKPQQQRSIQSVEEQQLLYFMMDLMACLRRAAVKQNMFSRELVSLRLSMSIILSCMTLSTEMSSEKICTEVCIIYICSQYFIVFSCCMCI